MLRRIVKARENNKDKLANILVKLCDLFKKDRKVALPTQLEELSPPKAKVAFHEPRIWAIETHECAESKVVKFGNGMRLATLGS